MLNNKMMNILIMGFLFLFLAACQSDNAVIEEDPNDTVTESSPTDDQETNANNKNPEVEEDAFVLPTETLQKGDKGKGVQVLQKALTQIGYEITSSGLFDRETVWALTDFQIQSEELMVTGIYDEDTKLALESFLEQELTIQPGEGLIQMEDESLDEDTLIIGNPYEVLALINKHNALPADYEPSDLVVPNVRFPFVEDLPKKQMRKVAAVALEKLFADADLEGLDLFAQSGYRSYSRQDYLFASYMANHGEEEANNFSARPGESEHQSGLTMDVTSPEVNNQLVIEFGETKEGKWLEENAHKYGFIIRYPKGKEDITKYQYEPWHLRYVGVKAATEMVDRGMTLEEYLED